MLASKGIVGESKSFTRERKKLVTTMNSSALSDDSDSDHSQQLLQQQQQTSSTMLLNTSMRVKSHDGGVSVFNSNNNKSNKVRAASTVASLQSRWSSWLSVLCSTKMLVLIVLSLQNSLFTVLRRYSQGVRKETYSTYEVLLVGEIIKMVFSAYMIREGMSCSVEEDNAISSKKVSNSALSERIRYLIGASGKMVGLALIYGAMNILSFVSLRNIGAGMFTIFAQCKILTTASFSALILHRKYSWTQWRALTALSFGVLLFSEPIWGKSENLLSKTEGAVVSVGVAAVLIEVTLSGFASIYFEKVIKTDPLQLSIWERNFQLALGSVPVYLGFIAWSGGGAEGLFGGWSFIAWIVALLGAAGGLLVALSIKYGDAILKTLATTAAIILSSVLDWAFLKGPLTPVMMIAAAQVILSICNYTFDPTPPETLTKTTTATGGGAGGEGGRDLSKHSDRPIRSNMEEIALLEPNRKSESA